MAAGGSPVAGLSAPSSGQDHCGRPLHDPGRGGHRRAGVDGEAGAGRIAGRGQRGIALDSAAGLPRHHPGQGAGLLWPGRAHAGAGAGDHPENPGPDVRPGHRGGSRLYRQKSHRHADFQVHLRRVRDARGPGRFHHRPGSRRADGAGADRGHVLHQLAHVAGLFHRLPGSRHIRNPAGPPDAPDSAHDPGGMRAADQLSGRCAEGNSPGQGLRHGAPRGGPRRGHVPEPEGALLQGGEDARAPCPR